MRRGLLVLLLCAVLPAFASKQVTVARAYTINGKVIWAGPNDYQACLRALHGDNVQYPRFRIGEYPDYTTCYFEIVYLTVDDDVNESDVVAGVSSFDGEDGDTPDMIDWNGDWSRGLPPVKPLGTVFNDDSGNPSSVLAVNPDTHEYYKAALTSNGDGTYSTAPDAVWDVVTQSKGGWTMTPLPDSSTGYGYTFKPSWNGGVGNAQTGAVIPAVGGGSVPSSFQRIVVDASTGEASVVSPSAVYFSGSASGGGSSSSPSVYNISSDGSVSDSSGNSVSGVSYTSTQTTTTTTESNETVVNEYTTINNAPIVTYSGGSSSGGSSSGSTSFNDWEYDYSGLLQGIGGTVSDGFSKLQDDMRLAEENRKTQLEVEDADGLTVAEKDESDLEDGNPDQEVNEVLDDMKAQGSGWGFDFGTGRNPIGEVFTSIFGNPPTSFGSQDTVWDTTLDFGMGNSIEWSFKLSDYFVPAFRSCMLFLASIFFAVASAKAISGAFA